jgi:hypothetical protein
MFKLVIKQLYLSFERLRVDSLFWIMSHFGIKARFQVRWVWVRKSTESLSFLGVFLVQESFHPRNSILRPFFRKTNTSIASERSKNLRLEIFVANGATIRRHAPRRSCRRTTVPAAEKSLPPPKNLKVEDDHVICHVSTRVTFQPPRSSHVYHSAMSQDTTSAMHVTCTPRRTR